MFTRRVPRDHAERGKHSARGADVVSRTGAAPGNESQARRRSHRPLPGRAAIRALTVENGQGNVACMLPGLLHFDANPTYICDSVTPSVLSDEHTLGVTETQIEVRFASKWRQRGSTRASFPCPFSNVSALSDTCPRSGRRLLWRACDSSKGAAPVLDTTSAPRAECYPLSA